MSQTKYYVKSCRYMHPQLGAVHVKVHGSTRHLRARWVGQEVCVTLPPDCPVDVYDNFLAGVQPRLLELRPKPAFSFGQIIDAPLADFEIVAATSPGGRDVSIVPVSDNALRGKKINYILTFNTRLASRDIADAALQDFINRSVIAAARHATSTLIVPRARELADRVDRHPLGWDVKETRTRLGSCSSSGIITLSPRLIFMPAELADFVIFHELAHLSEMNHSPAFHEVCDRYCGGREAELSRRVRAFRFPVF
ncbi:MAG: M48 family metallopeptidase [Muribaculaceae bacterium]|nr:M48 family metallopeptidase [Muribaculaceae bacterium]MDE6525687.1 M48 family metallopeptidase [Muribaculaceae bacterium]